MKRLPPSIITLIRNIASLEDSLLCLNNAQLNVTGAETVEKPAFKADYRLFGTFLRTFSFKSARILMEGRLTWREKAQLNTIYSDTLYPEQTF